MTQNSALKAGAGALAALAIGFGVAACGSSAAPGVATVPGDGLTSAAVTATTPAVTTPTSGPLSTRPTPSKPSGAAPTKLEVKTLTAGTGTAAADGDQLSVNYLGWLYKTGVPFSGGSSWTSATKASPYTIQLGEGEVIPGWDKGLVGVKQGSRVELIIPPSDAYGSTARSGIPANSTLVFVIDVLKVTKGTSTSSGATGSAAAGG